MSQVKVEGWAERWLPPFVAWFCVMVILLLVMAAALGFATVLTTLAIAAHLVVS